MTTTHERKMTTLLFNPFVYIAGAQALFLGISALVLTGFIGSMSCTHFDGVLDTHTNALIHVPVWFFISEGIIDWLCLAIVLLIIGRISSKTAFRSIDLLGTQALARWPTLFTSLVALPKGYQRFGDYLMKQVTSQGGNIQFTGGDAPIFIAVVFAMLLLLCWTVFLMYKAYSLSCNLKGGKAIGTFIAGVFFAEILSKITLYWLMKAI